MDKSTGVSTHELAGKIFTLLEQHRVPTDTAVGLMLFLAAYIATAESMGGCSEEQHAKSTMLTRTLSEVVCAETGDYEDMEEHDGCSCRRCEGGNAAGFEHRADKTRDADRKLIGNYIAAMTASISEAGLKVDLDLMVVTTTSIAVNCFIEACGLAQDRYIPILAKIDAVLVREMPDVDAGR